MTTLLSPVLQPWAQILGWTLIHFLWQGAVLGLVAWLALLLARRASAKVRYGLACAFLLLMVAAPVATFLVLLQASAGASGLTLGTEVAVPAAATLAQRLRTSLDPALPWLLAGWVAGVLLLSSRFLGSWIRVQRLRRRSAVPVPSEWHLVLSRLCRDLKLSRTVRLLQSAAVEVPTALGWLRPVILLPACALSGLAPLQLEAILAHELAHIRRGDFVVNLLQSLVEVLLFYHPAVWWLSSRIRTERELCCDDVAADLCGDPLILARALTDLEALREPVSPSPSHLAMAANGGSLMHRIRHLLHPALPVTSGARVTALALLAASLLGAAGVALQEKAATKSDKTTRIVDHDDQRKLDVRMKGEVKLNAEAPDPVVVAGDGSFKVEEKKAGKTRTYAATKDKATYTVDGKEQPLDKEAKDWVRGVAKMAAKAQAGKALAERHAVIAERHAAGAEAQARVMEIHARHMEEQAHELEAQARELEAHAEAMTPEERTRAKADLDRAKADLEKARAEGRKVRVEMIRKRGDGTVVLHKGSEGKDGEKHIEILTEDVGPGTVTIRKKVDGKEVVEKRVRTVRKGGKDAKEQTWMFMGPDGDEMVFEGLDQDIHIPPIHIPEIRLRRHPGAGHEGDRQSEIRALQEALKSIQSRLDQLQKVAPLPPMAPMAPVPPPPPPPPPVPPAPPAPPAP